MAKAIELQIQGDATTFKFDVEGEWLPRRELIFKAASNPPEVVEVRDVWEFRNCRIVSSDGTTATLWIDFKAFLARFESRGSAFPEWVRLVRDPSGANVELLKLGPTTHEDFRVEAVEGSTDDVTPAASWKTVANITIRVSAVIRNADANGIVGWEQTVEETYPDGLRILEWKTRITTKEGVNAVDKAKSFAKIDISSFSTYTYETNGPDGIEFSYSDADEQNSRVPTICEATSRIRQWGISIGATAGGTSPSSVSYSISTRETAEETVTTTNAEARGPNALSWVNGKAPASFSESEILDSQAEKLARGTWIHRRQKSSTPLQSIWKIKVDISGGHKTIDFEPVSGGFEPVKFIGSVTPWRASVAISVERRGSNLSKNVLLFPATLPPPWLLDRESSSESEPELTEIGIERSQDLWKREAKLSYLSGSKPPSTPSIVDQLRNGASVTSYYLR